MVKFVIIFMVLLVTQLVDSKPYQYLEPRSGYIPVYIRFGDQPLSEIHPLLARAFRETEIIVKNTKDDKDFLETKPKITSSVSEESNELSNSIITDNLEKDN